MKGVRHRLKSENNARPLNKHFQTRFCSLFLFHSNPHSSNINAPLFGALVRQGKTVFVALMSFAPYPDQWALLESGNKLKESNLDTIIEMNDSSAPPTLMDLAQPREEQILARTAHLRPEDAPRRGIPISAKQLFPVGNTLQETRAAIRYGNSRSQNLGPQEQARKWQGNYPRLGNCFANLLRLQQILCRIWLR
jgi:hypothetical protein